MLLMGFVLLYSLVYSVTNYPLEASLFFSGHGLDQYHCVILIHLCLFLSTCLLSKIKLQWVVSVNWVLPGHKMPALVGFVIRSHLACE